MSYHTDMPFTKKNQYYLLRLGLAYNGYDVNRSEFHKIMFLENRKEHISLIIHYYDDDDETKIPI